MRRFAIVLGCICGMLVGVPLIVLATANTGPGRRAIEFLANWGSGGSVRIVGLAGRFPDALHAERLELRDKIGAFAVIQDAALDWSPTRLIHGVLAVNALNVGTLALDRLPVSEAASSNSALVLPLPVIVTQLHIGRLALAAPVAGADTVATVDGSAALTSMTAGRLHLEAHVAANGASYLVDGAVEATGMRISATVSEPPGGLLARLAGLPDLGPIALKASLAGPRSALTIEATLTAGQLHAGATGQIDLARQTADLTVEATAPAMRPASDFEWQSVALNARIQGSFTAPKATGQLHVVRLTAGTFGVDDIAADLSGNAGAATLRATLTGTRVSAVSGDLLAKTPITIEATARLDTPDRSIQFTLRHMLLTVEGTGSTAGQLRAHLALTVPEVAPFAAALGGALSGGLTMTLDGTHVGDVTRVTTDGTLAAAADTATFHAAGTVRGQSVSLSDVRIDGQRGTMAFNGTIAPGSINLRGTAEVGDLAKLRPDLEGSVRIAASVEGSPDDLTIAADLTGSVATAGIRSGLLTAHLAMRGMPDAPQGTVTARGDLFGAPVTLAIAAHRDGNTIQAVVEHADWNSAHAQGTLRFDTADNHREGTLRLTVGRLADFAPLIGQPLAGDLSATLGLTGAQARLGLTVHNGALVGGAGSFARASLDATLDDLDATPIIDATLTVDGARTGGVAGSGSLRAKGPQDALALTIAASLPNLAGAPLNLTGAGTLDAVGQRLSLTSAKAAWRGKTLRLLAPVRIGFASGVVLDRLRLGLDQAELDVSGSIAPALDLTARVRALPASLARLFVPTLALDGTIGAEARLTGNPARPDGTVKVNATGLKLRQQLGRLLPPGRIDANATLGGGAAQIDVRAVAGKSRLTVTGRAPLAARGALDLRASGIFDIGLVDPLLAANGSHVAGSLTVNAGIAGTVAAPALSGEASLTNGEVRVDGLGVRLHGIEARFALVDGALRVTNTVAQAGSGTIRIDGSVGVLSPDMPVDLTLTARNARPLASDSLTASVDADLTIRGPAAALTVGGTLRAQEVDFRIPERMPASVATIDVRDPGQPPSAPAPPAPTVALNVNVEAPNRVFVRGRGMDVELGGSLQLRGTMDRPSADGGLMLRQGNISFAGQTLRFTRGTIDFNGASLVDPALKLVSTTSSAAVVVTLTVSGTPKAPKITLTSVPELPQDEVLAQLLFKRSVGALSPFEVAQIAAALASLSGVGPGIENPLSRVRQALGLDRLSVGTTARGGAALEAGRFVAPGVYVGTKQGASGGGQATVRIDIAKGLTLQGSTSTGGSATGAGGESNGSSVGVGYEFEY